MDCLNVKESAMISLGGGEVDWGGQDFEGTVDLRAPMIVEAMHALRESRVAQMTLMIRGTFERQSVDLCEVRPMRGVRCTSRWRRRALSHQTLVVDAVYAEMSQLFALPDQIFKDFVAKVTLVVGTGAVRVSGVRFLTECFPFEGWKNDVVLR